MRAVPATTLTLLLISAAPSISFAQVLTPFDSFPSPPYNERLDHPVPVATVARVGDIIALDGGRTVEDGRGEPFVLGAATLDLRDRAHAKILFTMANATETPILLDDVVVQEARFCSVPGQNHPVGFPFVGGRAGGFHGAEELPPGGRVTVQIPVPPNCAGKGVDTVGIVVRVGRPGPHESSSSPSIRATTTFYPDKELLSRVFGLRPAPPQ